MSKKPSEIIKEYLISNQYDGLCSIIRCRCTVDDFAPCENISDDCFPARYVSCQGALSLCYEDDDACENIIKSGKQCLRPA